MMTRLAQRCAVVLQWAGQPCYLRWKKHASPVDLAYKVAEYAAVHGWSVLFVVNLLSEGATVSLGPKLGSLSEGRTQPAILEDRTWRHLDSILEGMGQSHWPFRHTPGLVRNLGRLIGTRTETGSKPWALRGSNFAQRMRDPTQVGVRRHPVQRKNSRYACFGSHGSTQATSLVLQVRMRHSANWHGPRIERPEQSLACCCSIHWKRAAGMCCTPGQMWVSTLLAGKPDSMPGLAYPASLQTRNPSWSPAVLAGKSPQMIQIGSRSPLQMGGNRRKIQTGRKCTPR